MATEPGEGPERQPRPQCGKTFALELLLELLLLELLLTGKDWTTTDAMRSAVSANFILISTDATGIAEQFDHYILGKSGHAAL